MRIRAANLIITTRKTNITSNYNTVHCQQSNGFRNTIISKATEKQSCAMGRKATGTRLFRWIV